MLIDDSKAPPEKREIETIVGLDLGLHAFIASSDGVTVVCAPQHFRRLGRKLQRASRAVSRKRKGSRNRRKAVGRLQRVHAQIADARSDFTHKLSKQVVSENDLIVVEKLNVAGMARGRFAKSILDAAWGQFLFRLRYKAESAGATFVEVNPHGTSQECSRCGENVPKDLSVRVHVCPHCGLVVDRDVNAARNILARGLSELSTAGRAGIHACGETPVGGLVEAGSSGLFSN